MKFRTKVKVVVTLFAVILAIGTAKAQQPVMENLHLTLERALEIALDQNLSVKIADEEIKRVDWIKQENWYTLFPSLSANAQYTNNILKPVFFSDFFPGGKMEIGSTNSYAVTGTMQLPIFSLAIFKNIQMSEIEMKSALESLRSTKIDLIAQVKNSFYGVLMLEKSLKVLEDSYKNARETADNIKKTYENGLASEYDMIRSDVSVRNILPSITQAKSGLELSKMQLKVLLSIDLNTPVVLEGSISQMESQIGTPPSATELSLENNSSIRSMDIQMERVDKSIELIRSQRLPSLAGFANYQLQMQSEDFTFGNRWTNSVAVGLAIQIPIFNKMSYTLKERQTQVVARQLQMQREQLENNLSIALVNSINEMNRAQVQLISDKEAVRQAQKGYEISKVRYNTGAGTLLELNDSEVALTRSRLNFYQTIYDYIKAKNDFEKVSGDDKLINK
ncbi:MAG: TolC family protein [Bacteroidales bacterium]|nr:TolC family protein [Bacteroidales bacterium]